MIRVCFVCLGNICRSPTAHGVMQHLIDARGLEGRVLVESAGTGAWHVGAPPDRRSQETARRRGFRLPGVAEHFDTSYFERFDLILAMDQSNLENMQKLARTDAERAKLELFRAFDPEAAPHAEVPDPYYGGPDGFEHVFDLCERTCEALLDYLLSERAAARFAAV